MSIEVKNITKTFGNFAALRDVSLHVKAGELIALLGPSGSGKTTLLRIIAGLEEADQGTVLFDGTDVTERAVGKRRVGFVFQHYALFRHMSVFENIAFGLRVRKRALRPGKAEIRERVTKLLQLVQLDKYASRYPSQLSGGQRQRVALARALAVEPEVLLLDEPFGALDAKVRRELRQWLRRLHDEMGITSVFVTHDQDEALELADRVAVMNEGRIEQLGTPDEVYDKPASAFVYNFLGSVNIFRGRLTDGLVDAAGEVLAEDRSNKRIAFVRPHELEIQRTKNGAPSIEATVRHVSTVGPLVRLSLLRTGTDDPIEAHLTREHHRELDLKPGDTVYAIPKNARVFAEDYSI